MNWKDTVCREEAIQETIRRSKAAFFEAEGARPLSRWEFLLQQSRYIQKHWWLLQGGLLILLWCVLRSADSSQYMQRSLGVAGPLFALLALPELWKNRGCNAMEVEGAALYSLRQIYAARFTLFAGADVLLLSLFFLGVQRSGMATLWELLVQFLLPCNVSCCICFSCLYSRQISSEALCLVLCGIWTAFWESLLLRDAVYQAISPALWGALLAASFAFLGWRIFRGQRSWSKTWEVKPIWN